MKGSLLYISLSLIVFASCIGDDFVMDGVDPEIRITTQVDTLAIGSKYQFEFIYLNNIGEEEMVEAAWTSSDTSIIRIELNGTAIAVREGVATLQVTYNDVSGLLQDQITVAVGAETVTSTDQRSGTIKTTSSYLLTGDFILRQEQDDLIVEIAENYQASTALPGLYVYLTNNPNTTNNALEIGAVIVFSGAHSYTLTNVDLNEYNYILYFCKPFNVKVGDGKID